MENPTPFDLNEAIRRWQQELGVSAAFSADNLEELASHLRASAQKLKATGLSEEEAFQIAVRRMGERGQLEQEFAKVNLPVAWSPAVLVFWLVTGMFLFQVAFSVSVAILFSLHTYQYGEWMRTGPHPVGSRMPFWLPDFQFNGAILLVLAFYIWARITIGDWKRFNRLIRLFEHPIRPAFTLTALGLASNVLPAVITIFFTGWPDWFAFEKPDWKASGEVFWRWYLLEASLIFIWVLGMVFLARRAMRNNATSQRAAQ